MNPFSSLASTNISPFINIKPRAPARLEGHQSPSKFSHSLPNRFWGSDASFSQNTDFFLQAKTTCMEPNGAQEMLPEIHSGMKTREGGGVVVVLRSVGRLAVPLRPRRRRSDKKGTRKLPGMRPIVLISTIGFMNIPAGRRVCGLFKQDINQW